MNRLADWIESLPLPIGVIAVTDARTKHLLQACDKTNRLVPDQVSKGIFRHEMLGNDYLSNS
jgi:LacI family transcriptional regulator